MQTLLIGFASLIVGGGVAGAAVVGVVSSQTAPPSTSPTTVTSVGIDPTSYGSEE